MRRAFLGVPVITLSLAFAEDVNAARRASPSRRNRDSPARVRGRLAWSCRSLPTPARLTPAASKTGGLVCGPRYDRDYYTAIVLNPDGSNVEAVCRKPVASEQSL